MENMILYVVSSAIQMIVLYIYLREIVGVKRKFGWMVGCWLGLEIVNFTVDRLAISIIPTSVTSVLLLVIIVFVMCSGNWKRKVILIFVYYGVEAIIEVILVGVVTLCYHCTVDMITSNEVAVTFLLILTQIITFIILQLVKYLWKKQLQFDTNTKDWIRMFLVSIGCFYAMLALTVEMIEEANFSINRISVLLVLVAVNFLSYYFYCVSVENNRVELESQIYQQQISMYQEWYESNKHTRNEIRSFRHDINNHFAVIRNLCENEKIFELQKYLDEIVTYAKINTYHTDSGNMLLDAIIDLKKSYALSKGIDINVKVKIPEGINYNSMDMVIVFANLLDNAIEACERIDSRKEILLHIGYEMKNLMIEIENTYDGEMDEKNGTIIEEIPWKTKKDSSEHGIGMQNIMNVVKKYNGSIEWKADDNRMKMVILLYEIV